MVTAQVVRAVVENKYKNRKKERERERVRRIETEEDSAFPCSWKVYSSQSIQFGFRITFITFLLYTSTIVHSTQEYNYYAWYLKHT